MSGRSERAAANKTHRPALGKFYGVERSPITPGEFEFTVDVASGTRRWVNIDTWVTGVSWEDTDEVMTGTLNLQRPVPERPELPVQAGYRVRLRTRWAGRTYEVWEMQALPENVDPVTGAIDVDLTDDLVNLKRNRRNWRYRKSKRHPKGWLCDEVIRDVARTEGLRVGSIIRGTKRLDPIKFERKSALDVIKEAVKQEADKTGRQYVIRFRNGRLEITPYRRNRMLYVLGDTIEDAGLTYTTAERPVTVIEAKGRIGKGRAARTHKVDVMNRTVVRRFGFSQETKDYGRVTSVSDLRDRAKIDLAKKIRKTRSGSISSGGIPFVLRGDGFRWVNKEPGWHGPSQGSLDRTYVFVTGISHAVDGSRYTMQVSFDQVDPFEKDRERRAKDAREKKKKARAGKK
jgi:hypothetical protein